MQAPAKPVEAFALRPETPVQFRPPPLMDRYVAFLRGMNLGGRRITNEELRSHFEALGCEEVATFRASGNVILSCAGDSEEKLTTRLEVGLGERLGYEVPVFLRSADELR